MKVKVNQDRDLREAVDSIVAKVGPVLADAVLEEMSWAKSQGSSGDWERTVTFQVDRGEFSTRWFRVCTERAADPVRFLDNIGCDEEAFLLRAVLGRLGSVETE